MSKHRTWSSLVVTMGLLVVIALSAGCTRGGPSQVRVLPASESIPGWTPESEPQAYNREDLYDLVDGQAESFFAYGFEQADVQRYQRAGGATLTVQIWRLAEPADAFGLFTASLAGSPVDIGNDGDGELGRRVAFWQDRFYVQIFARQELPNADLLSFASAVSSGLPSGGDRPALVRRLPSHGLAERSILFFHEEISLQDHLWLGGENPLELSPETDGVLAEYELNGATVRLLLVSYPGSGAPSAAVTALLASDVESLVVAEARGDSVGAVFGQVEKDAAKGLLSEALDDR